MFEKARGPVIFTKPNIVLIQRHSVPSFDGNLLIHSTSVYVLLQFPMDSLIDRPPRRKYFCLRNEVLSHYFVSGKQKIRQHYLTLNKVCCGLLASRYWDHKFYIGMFKIKTGSPQIWHAQSFRCLASYYYKERTRVTQNHGGENIWNLHSFLSEWNLKKLVLLSIIFQNHSIWQFLRKFVYIGHGNSQYSVLINIQYFFFFYKD